MLGLIREGEGQRFNLRGRWRRWRRRERGQVRKRWRRFQYVLFLPAGLLDLHRHRRRSFHCCLWGALGRHLHRSRSRCRCCLLLGCTTASCEELRSQVWTCQELSHDVFDTCFDFTAFTSCRDLHDSRDERAGRRCGQKTCQVRFCCFAGLELKFADAKHFFDSGRCSCRTTFGLGCFLSHD